MASQTYPYVTGSNCTFPLIESTWPAPCSSCCTVTVGSILDPVLAIFQAFFLVATLAIWLYSALCQYQLYVA